MVEYDAEKNEEEMEDGKEFSKGKVMSPHPQTCRKAGLQKVQEQLLKLAQLSLKQDGQGSLELPNTGGEAYVGMCDRDSAVTSIRVMQRFYSFSAHTFVSAIDYLDRFLSKVKVKPRYLSCISAACFYMSAKMNEESEDIPTATELSSIHREVWKPSDLKRMEKVVLDKLGWSLFPSSSSLAFLEIMLDVLQKIGVAGVDRKFWAEVVKRLELFLNYSSCCLYKSSSLAMATLLQCLKIFNLSTPVTNFIMLQLQAACQISDSELFDCQCAISQQLDFLNSHSTSHPPCLPLPKIAPRPNLVTKPSWYGGTDLPTIEEVSWDHESSEKETDVLYQQEKSCPLDSVDKMPDIGLIKSSSCPLLEQCFVGKIGAIYGDYKCNITQA